MKVDREAREKMGFPEGWGRCADPLSELAARIGSVVEVSAGNEPVDLAW